MANYIDVTEANFEQEVVWSELPVVAVFWAMWSGPNGKEVPLMIDEIAGERKGRFKYVRINTDEEKNLCGAYGVIGIPTVAVFKYGDKISSKISKAIKPELEQFIDEHI